jgi:Phosphotransferase enzyme family
MTAHQSAEVPLHGGFANRGLVVRVGDTVRRPQRTTSAATHALLQHLQGVSFDGAPRFLGVDSKGREVLSYIPGDAVTPPYPAWALTDPALVSVAELLRRYHAAVATFDPGPYRWPPSPPPPYAGNLVSHNDPNLDNVVFRNGRAAAFIDFDLSSPGSVLWDIAAAARFWAPLRIDADIADSRRGQSLRRFHTFVNAYGIHDFDPTQLVDAVRVNHDWLYAVVRSGAEHGNPGFIDYWRQACDRVNRTRHWYAANQQPLADALAGRYDNWEQSGADAGPAGAATV